MLNFQIVVNKLNKYLNVPFIDSLLFQVWGFLSCPAKEENNICYKYFHIVILFNLNLNNRYNINKCYTLMITKLHHQKYIQRFNTLYLYEAQCIER